jgi:hypothetical protein
MMSVRGVATYTKITTAPAARIRRVVFDHAVKTLDFAYSQASSMVISPAADAMVAM